MHCGSKLWTVQLDVSKRVYGEKGGKGDCVDVKGGTSGLGGELGRGFEGGASG